MHQSGVCIDETNWTDDCPRILQIYVYIYIYIYVYIYNRVQIHMEQRIRGKRECSCKREEGSVFQYRENIRRRRGDLTLCVIGY